MVGTTKVCPYWSSEDLFKIFVGKLLLFILNGSLNTVVSRNVKVLMFGAATSFKDYRKRFQNAWKESVSARKSIIDDYFSFIGNSIFVSLSSKPVSEGHKKLQKFKLIVFQNIIYKKQMTKGKMLYTDKWQI